MPEHFATVHLGIIPRHLSTGNETIYNLAGLLNRNSSRETPPILALCSKLNFRYISIVLFSLLSSDRCSFSLLFTVLPLLYVRTLRSFFLYFERIFCIFFSLSISIFTLTRQSTPLLLLFFCSPPRTILFVYQSLCLSVKDLFLFVLILIAFCFNRLLLLILTHFQINQIQGLFTFFDS